MMMAKASEIRPAGPCFRARPVSVRSQIGATIHTEIALPAIGREMCTLPTPVISNPVEGDIEEDRDAIMTVRSGRG